MAGRKQKPPVWTEAFLDALARSGNARLAAVEAGVDHSTAYQRRLKHPAFAEAWARVLEERDASATKPSLDPTGRSAASAELIVRESARHGPQLVRAGVGRWSKRAEEKFLTALAATGSIKRAIAFAGFSDTAIYRRRMKDRRFAESWDHAVTIGRARIDAYLVEAADRTFDPASILDDADVPKMTIAEAIKVLQVADARSRRTAAGGGGGGPSGRGWTGPEDWDDGGGDAEMDELRESIIGKLDRIRQRDDEQKLAAGWTRYGDDWIPPGFAAVGMAPLPEPGLADAEAEARDVTAEDDEPAGPRIRGL